MRRSPRVSPRSGAEVRARRSRAAAARVGHAGDTSRLTSERNDEVRDALKRAFALLDADQQDAARKLLADRDIEVEVLVPGAAAGSAEP